MSLKLAGITNPETIRRIRQQMRITGERSAAGTATRLVNERLAQIEYERRFSRRPIKTKKSSRRRSSGK